MNKFDLYYEVARERFNSQDDLRREFDRRATNIISVGGVLLGLGFVYLRLKTPVSALSFSDPEGVALVCVFVMFLITAGHCLYLRWPKDWHHNPHPEGLCENLGGFDDDGLTKWAAEEYTGSIDRNQPRLDKTAKLLRMAMLWLVLEVLALTAVFFTSFV